LPLAAGFLSPTWWSKFDVRSGWFGGCRLEPRWEEVEIDLQKQRTLLAFQASRVLEKLDDREILNYLLTSLVRSSLAKLGRELVAPARN
jgi:hypothetical protein